MCRGLGLHFGSYFSFHILSQPNVSSHPLMPSLGAHSSNGPNTQGKGKKANAMARGCPEHIGLAPAPAPCTGPLHLRATISVSATTIWQQHNSMAAPGGKGPGELPISPATPIFSLAARHHPGYHTKGARKNSCWVLWGRWSHDGRSTRTKSAEPIDVSWRRPRSTRRVFARLPEDGS